MKDCPFSLDTLKDIPRLVQKEMFMPEEKKGTFIEMRESILKCGKVSVLTLQKHFLLASFSRC